MCIWEGIWEGMRACGGFRWSLLSYRDTAIQRLTWSDVFMFFGYAETSAAGEELR